MMKATMLLATGLFLASAPAPDADDIAEITHNFIVPADVPGLLAAGERHGDTVASSLDAATRLPEKQASHLRSAATPGGQGPRFD